MTDRSRWHCRRRAAYRRVCALHEVAIARPSRSAATWWVGVYTMHRLRGKMNYGFLRHTLDEVEVADVQIFGSFTSKHSLLSTEDDGAVPLTPVTFSNSTPTRQCSHVHPTTTDHRDRDAATHHHYTIPALNTMPSHNTLTRPLTDRPFPSRHRRRPF